MVGRYLKRTMWVIGVGFDISEGGDMVEGVLSGAVIVLGCAAVVVRFMVVVVVSGCRMASIDGSWCCVR